MRDWIKTALGLIFLAGLVGLPFGEASLTRVKAQQTTDTTPSYNGTSTGSIITVTYTDGANVRAGPSSYDYPEVGPKLLTGDTALALGRSPGGDWIEIAYPSAPGGVAWVYAALVSLPQDLCRLSSLHLPLLPCYLDHGPDHGGGFPDPGHTHQSADLYSTPSATNTDLHTEFKGAPGLASWMDRSWVGNRRCPGSRYYVSAS